MWLAKIPPWSLGSRNSHLALPTRTYTYGLDDQPKKRVRTCDQPKLPHPPTWAENSASGLVGRDMS